MHFPDRAAANREESQQHRERYQQNRDPQAMRWLLGQRIQAGMSLVEVNQVLGEQGKRRYDDRRLKTHGGNYLTSDVFYQWGPDSDGKNVILGFRDGKLTNFEPRELR